MVKVERRAWGDVREVHVRVQELRDRGGQGGRRGVGRCGSGGGVIHG